MPVTATGIQAGTLVSSIAAGNPGIINVSLTAVATANKLATSGDVNTSLSKFNLDNRQIPILVRLNDKSRSDLERLQNLSVPGRNGPVPLANVADVSLGAGPAQITRVDRSRKITLNADLFNAFGNNVVLAQVERQNTSTANNITTLLAPRVARFGVKVSF